ncbi:MAG: serpin family protein [Eubacteriales bacterium]|nr:serpin family protein [Eubacteriales bacterium]
MRKRAKGAAALCLVMAALLLMSACKGAAPAKEEESALAKTVSQNSFDTDNLDAFSWALLRSLPASEGNVAISPVETATMLAMMQVGAADGIDAQISALLGAQEVSPKRVNEYTLQRRKLITSWSASPAAVKLEMMVGENQPVPEAYLSTLRSDLELEARFQAVSSTQANSTFSAWADDASMGLVTGVSWELPAAAMPYILSLQYIQNYWQTAQDPARTVPVAFTYASGDTSAVPMVAIAQNCGIYHDTDGAMGILPLTDDNYRLVLMMPGEDMTLDQLLENVVECHTRWRKDADWGEQRVALPKFSARYDASLKESLNILGVRDAFRMESGLPQLGSGAYLADALVSSTFVVDESGTAEAKETKPFRPGMDDGVETLILNKPFLFALEDTKTGTIVMCGIVRDPMATLK